MYFLPFLQKIFTFILSWMSEVKFTQKQQNIYDLFKKLGLTEIDAKQASFGTDKSLYRMDTPKIFKIGNTNNLLVFGDLKKSLSYEQIQAFLKEQLKNSKQNNEHEEIEKEMEEGVEIDGEQSTTAMLEKMNLETNDKLKEEDIKFLIEETKASREDAIESLKKSNYDVIAALVEMNKGK